MILTLIIVVEPLKEGKITSQYEYIDSKTCQEKLIGATRLSLIMVSDEIEKNLIYLREGKERDTELWKGRNLGGKYIYSVPLCGTLHRFFC